MQHIILLSWLQWQFKNQFLSFEIIYEFNKAFSLGWLACKSSFSHSYVLWDNVVCLSLVLLILLVSFDKRQSSIREVHITQVCQMFYWSTKVNFFPGRFTLQIVLCKRQCICIYTTAYSSYFFPYWHFVIHAVTSQCYLLAYE